MPATTATTRTRRGFGKNLFTQDSFSTSRLPAPYNTIPKECTRPETISHNNTAGAKSKLNGFVMKALIEYCAGTSSNIGVLKMGRGSYASQWTQPDGSSILVSATKNGAMYACIRNSAGNHSPIPDLSISSAKFDTTSILIVLMLIMADINEDNGVKDHAVTKDLLNQAVAEVSAGNAIPDDILYLVSDDMYYTIAYDHFTTGVKREGIDLLNADRVNDGEFTTGDVLCGDPDILKPAGSKSSTSMTETMTVKEAKEAVKEYTDTLHWTPEEEELIPVFPDDTPVPPEISKVISRFVKTRGTKLPMNNFCWRGITAYGKSTGVSIMACVLHTPKAEFTCSYNTDENDFHSQFVPNSDMSTAGISASLPSFEDIRNDPDGAYEQITGQAKTDVSYDEVLQAYGSAVAARSGGARFKLVESDYVKALTHGWICEVQEFSRIRDAGVLVKLNKYDQPGSIIPLVNGDHLRRHENAIVFYTDNVGYASSRPVDQSVIRRMSFVIDSYEMPKKRAIARIKANTGFKNDDLLDKLYNVWVELVKYCKDHDINEGPISLTELERWVSVVGIEGTANLEETCMECIIGKVTSDPDTQNEIRDNSLKLACSSNGL